MHGGGMQPGGHRGVHLDRLTSQLQEAFLSHIVGIRSIAGHAPGHRVYHRRMPFDQGCEHVRIPGAVIAAENGQVGVHERAR